MLIVLNESVPFVIFRHSNWSSPKIIDSCICCVGFTLQNSCICVVGFLNFPNNNSLKLSSRSLEIEVCLPLLVFGSAGGNSCSYLVKVVFFINLPFYLPVCCEFQ